MHGDMKTDVVVVTMGAQRTQVAHGENAELVLHMDVRAWLRSQFIDGPHGDESLGGGKHLRIG